MTSFWKVTRLKFSSVQSDPQNIVCLLCTSCHIRHGGYEYKTYALLFNSVEKGGRHKELVQDRYTLLEPKKKQPALLG